MNIQMVLHVRTVAQSTTFYSVYICLYFLRFDIVEFNNL